MKAIKSGEPIMAKKRLKVYVKYFRQAVLSYQDAEHALVELLCIVGIDDDSFKRKAGLSTFAKANAVKDAVKKAAEASLDGKPIPKDVFLKMLKDTNAQIT